MPVEHARHFDARGALPVKDHVSSNGNAADRTTQFRAPASHSGRSGKQAESRVDIIDEIIGGGRVVARGV